jgi:hypothetical protein
MAKNQLKSVALKAPETPDHTRPTGRPDANLLRQVAADAGRSIPPAIVRPARRTVLINVKVDETLALALADRAQAEGVTQKQVIMRALAMAGLPVPPLDLEDRTPRRRTAP